MSHSVTLIVVVLLLCGSAIFSGLNVAFMSLDPNDLRRKAKLGNAAAKRMLPFRQRTHLTLAAILLSNVAAASALALVLGDAFNGFIAGILSTLLLVIFGEIIPQAYFARNALVWCNRFWPVLQLMITVTYPVSKPLQLLLDKLFGKEEPRLHSRHELGVMISEHLGSRQSELDEDEVEIIRGALQLSEKQVRQIMTPIKHTYWLTPDTMINDAKIDEIKDSGHSRIPVFNGRLTTCYGVLLVKDLVDVNFDEEPQPVADLPLYPAQLVGGKTALDTMFRKFINASTHLIPIERDDVIIGIVTIEDLIEEILGHEIHDESDRRPPAQTPRQPAVPGV